MKRIYNVFSTSRVRQPARFFLLPMILSALISFSGAVSSVSAQTTAEVCRETQKVIEQYQREEQEATTNAYYKNNEMDMRRNLSILNKAISNGNLLNDRNLGALAHELFLTLPKEPIQMTPDERSAFQRQARSILVQKIQEISGFTLEELDQKGERIKQQLSVRRERFKTLNCDEVLSRGKDLGSTPIDGSTIPMDDWTGTQNSNGKESADWQYQFTFKLTKKGSAYYGQIFNEEPTEIEIEGSKFVWTRDVRKSVGEEKPGVYTQTWRGTIERNNNGRIRIYGTWSGAYASRKAEGRNLDFMLIKK